MVFADYVIFYFTADPSQEDSVIFAHYVIFYFTADPSQEDSVIFAHYVICFFTADPSQEDSDIFTHCVICFLTADPSQEDSVIFAHYVICNNTQQTLRLGQVGTDENLVLQPREMHQYSWRSHTMKQVKQIFGAVFFPDRQIDR
ncbi:hypothetical protein DPMN_103718 [Dreissena polymorpha]|uniref:Uncharacterized protein n=1 Tax=Dreissena polymorpha TaxID=45954 RepID=A0A9D4HBN6_DREPO|nr:hypothetical protein DPMN_103718 [Dreissena polymorpha]